MSEGRTRLDVHALFRHKSDSISHAVVGSVQHLTLAKAAAKLGVSCTTLKKKCRTLGLMRWGPRRRQMLAKMRAVESDAETTTPLMLDDEGMRTLVLDDDVFLWEHNLLSPLASDAAEQTPSAEAPGQAEDVAEAPWQAEDMVEAPWQALEAPAALF